MSQPILSLQSQQTSFIKVFIQLWHPILLVPLAWSKVIVFLLLLIGCFLGLLPVTQAQDILLGLTSKGGTQGVGTAFSIRSNGTDFTIRKAFEESPYSPASSLCKGRDGNFYGMTEFGGNYDGGTIFRMTPSGTVTILRSLKGDDGEWPQGSLVQGSDGDFYGMTTQEGKNRHGTIFKITSTGIFTVLFSFSSYLEGLESKGSLVEGSDGSFYGMTYYGGTYLYGTIFKFTKNGVFTVLHNFNYNTDGGQPYGDLIQGSDGNFYGMTTVGGKNMAGTIFRISPGGTFSVRRQLDFKTDGAYPYGSLTKGPDGNLYGMTHRGGKNDDGTIFKISTSNTFTVLRHLYYVNDGGLPYGSLVLGLDGNLYGLTSFGGTNENGTFFKISSKGTFNVLHHFDKPVGLDEKSDLVLGNDGNYYGIGSENSGSIFKLTPSGKYSLLVQFPEASKGSEPKGSLVQGADGNFYGMTTRGGTNYDGTIFKMCNNSYSTLKSFSSDTTGDRPEGSLIQGKDGNFYGMTSTGGTHSSGTIFKVTPKGTLTILHHFAYDGIDDTPKGSLVEGLDGDFYGMSYSDGPDGYGTIFKITANGEFTLLRNLNLAKDGGYPKGNLIQGTDGSFYGMNGYGGINDYGTIFKITSGGKYTVLYNFKNGEEGAYPSSGLVQGLDGNLYGMTYDYGTNSTVFKITPKGTLTVLHHLDYTTEGGESKGSLVQGSDGSFFGITNDGGKNNSGTIFKITPEGTFTVLRHLNPDTDGSNPTGGLIIQKANPLAYDQNVNVVEETAKAILLHGTAPGSPLVYNIVTKPKNGSLSGTGANRTYTPKTNFAGSDSFTYSVTWGCQTSAIKKVSISVSNMNDAPVLAAISSKSVTLGNALTFTATATDPDGDQTKTFSLTNAPTGATINASTGAFSWTPTTAGTYLFIVKVTDNGSPVLSDEEQIQVIVTNSSLATVRINSGGGALNTSLGKFEADAYLNGSSMVSTKPLVVANTTDDELYQDYRLATNIGGHFGYSIPVANGTYSVKLHFVELFHTTSGKRSFNVSVEGNAWLNNYDIFLAAGGAQRAVVASNIVKVTDGALDLVFVSILDRASISAIEVVPENSGTRLAMSNKEKVIFNLQGSLYPNPVSERFTVKWSMAAEQISTTITDLTGAVRGNNIHYRISSTSLEIPVTSLPASVYFLQLKTEHGQQTFKFIKE